MIKFSQIYIPMYFVGGNTKDYFSIIDGTGDIVLGKPIQSSEQSQFALLIKASEESYPWLNSTCQVKV